MCSYHLDRMAQEEDRVEIQVVAIRPLPYNFAYIGPSHTV